MGFRLRVRNRIVTSLEACMTRTGFLGVGSVNCKATVLMFRPPQIKQHNYPKPCFWLLPIKDVGFKGCCEAERVLRSVPDAAEWWVWDLRCVWDSFSSSGR